MDVPFVRDEAIEEMAQELIYLSAHGPEPDGEPDGELDGDDDDFNSQFENNSGERLVSEERRDDEVSLTNSGEVYLIIY